MTPKYVTIFQPVSSASEEQNFGNLLLAETRTYGDYTKNSLTMAGREMH
jgi:hypothetical protein